MSMNDNEGGYGRHSPQTAGSAKVRRNKGAMLGLLGGAAGLLLMSTVPGSRLPAECCSLHHLLPCTTRRAGRRRTGEAGEGGASKSIYNLRDNDDSLDECTAATAVVSNAQERTRWSTARSC